MPEHRRVLGRSRRHGYGYDNDHGRHLHEGVQVTEATRARERVFLMSCFCVVCFLCFAFSCSCFVPCAFVCWV